MTASPSIKYKAEPADQILVTPLDSLTLVYQRRSGITHIVAEPAPEILATMGADALTADEVAQRLAAQFDFDSAQAADIIAARLNELADLGLVERCYA
ncbi:MAG: HPr-rel-A system PqqD family peptide chaperone [Sphingorhabdus sp.]|uniref:HPr-rel-A system PqqD family peptide chaperone n=1 Tax=Sphingorhabdus sp. TaxID=1902408 RepID=UPI0038FD1D60